MERKEHKIIIKKEQWEIFFYGTIGLVLTVLSFLLFHRFNDWVLVTVLLCLVDVVYTYRNVQVFFRFLKRKIEQPIMILFFMLMYWLTLLALICLCRGIADVPFSYTCLVYPVFLMPSFEIVIILLSVIMMGI